MIHHVHELRKSSSGARGLRARTRTRPPPKRPRGKSRVCGLPFRTFRPLRLWDVPKLLDEGQLPKLHVPTAARGFFPVPCPTRRTGRISEAASANRGRSFPAPPEGRPHRVLGPPIRPCPRRRRVSAPAELSKLSLVRRRERRQCLLITPCSLFRDRTVGPGPRRALSRALVGLREASTCRRSAFAAGTIATAAAAGRERRRIGRKYRAPGRRRTNGGIRRLTDDLPLRHREPHLSSSSPQVY